eukprot:CAMPEP_0204606750 /NCGR_PEP_ID=MMETSP0661-20131031/59262_1 /ASSEMBLY_ACC=CAM_ASM_000606 /TAXON_ID=109239 /ORGANISM="Alexandrium margalefi, Strain AMGDE01CS-322" /LENGTH=519 /DNA_ID=CAMNT_0051618103 /DNA_START=81 /DNA_END=1640 /DNA_ORIENTATION=+
MSAAAETDYVPPFQKKYFSQDMVSKFEPLMDAMVKVEETEGGDAAAFKEFESHWEKFMDFSWCSQWDGKKYDVVFYGMSGYSGYLMMEYLKRNTLKNKKEPLTFAFAGRSVAKVAEMRDREFAGTEWAETPILTASFDDVVSIIDLVKSAHVIVNCAGPYMLTEGEVLLDACIWCKTDYVDVSQEVPWTLRIKELHKYAVDAGVMVVPSCGGGAYSDLGVYLLSKKLRDDFGEATRSAVCYCSGGGTAAGCSGGTLRTRAAMGNVDRDTTAAMADPYSMGGYIPEYDRNGIKVVDIQLGTGICVPSTREEDKDENMTKISEDKKLGVWRAPYVSSFFDTRVVRRSNMLMADLGNQPYGAAMNFMEYAMLPAEQVAAAKRNVKEGRDEQAKPMGQYGMSLEEEEAMLKSEGREFKEGEGPALEDISDAYSAFFLHAESVNGNQAKCSFVGADGYFETSRVAVETALTLRFDRSKLAFKGGVLTPSTAGGSALVDRLVSSGVKFKMGEWLESSDLAPPKIA